MRGLTVGAGLTLIVGGGFVLAGLAAAPGAWVYLTGLVVMAVAITTLVRSVSGGWVGTAVVAVVSCGLVFLAIVMPWRQLAEIDELGLTGRVAVVGHVGDITYVRNGGGLHAVEPGGSVAEIVQAGTLLPGRMVSISADWVVVGGGASDDEETITAFTPDGDELWRREVPGSAGASQVVAAADASTLVVVDCTEECRLIGLDRRGEERWTEPIGGDYWYPTGEYTPPRAGQVLPDEIWLSDLSGDFVSTWAMDGTQRRDLEDTEAFPAPGRTTVLRDSQGGCRLRGVDATGEVWRTTAPERACDGPGYFRSSGELLYLGDEGVAVDRASGEVASSERPRDSELFWASRGWGPDQVWDLDDRTRVSVTDPLTGDELWSATSSGEESAVSGVGPGGTAARVTVRTANPFVERRGDVDGFSRWGAAQLLVAAPGESEPRRCTVPRGRDVLTVLSDGGVLALTPGFELQVIRCD